MVDVQSLSRVWLFEPHELQHQASLSCGGKVTITQYNNHSTIISCMLFSLINLFIVFTKAKMCFCRLLCPWQRLKDRCAVTWTDSTSWVVKNKHLRAIIALQGSFSLSYKWPGHWPAKGQFWGKSHCRSRPTTVGANWEQLLKSSDSRGNNGKKWWKMKNQEEVSEVI